MLVLDERVCWSKSSFDDVAQWNECKSELKCYCTNYHVQTKSHDRDNKHKNDNNEYISEHTGTDEDDDLDQESYADARFSFHRTIPD